MNSRTRKHFCPVCRKERKVNDLGRIAAHDIKRGRRCTGGGLKVGKLRMGSDTVKYIAPR